MFCLGQSVEEKMEEIRLVNWAKRLIIREQKVSEPDSHHHITPSDYGSLLFQAGGLRLL